MGQPEQYQQDLIPPQELFRKETVVEKTQDGIKIGNDITMSEKTYLSGQTYAIIIALTIVAIFYLSLRYSPKARRRRKGDK